MLKKIIVLMAIVSVFFSCTMINEPSKVCPPPENQPSWICEKSAELDVTPEKVYGWIYSASAIAAISDIVEIEWICNFKKEIDQWYLASFPISYESLIVEVLRRQGLIKDERKALLIKNIINQNFQQYSSPMLIGAYDDWMLRAGSVKFNKDMLCQ